MASFGNALSGFYSGLREQGDYDQRQQHNKQLMALQQMQVLEKQKQEQGAGLAYQAALSGQGQGQQQPDPMQQQQPSPMQGQPLPPPNTPVSDPWARGMKPELAAALSQLFAAGKGQGFNLGISPQGGFRTHKQQAGVYGRDLASHGGKPSGMVAAPGQSMHEVGGAGDVTEGGQLVRGGPADQFLGANVGRYGLKRPMAKEPWHLELAQAGLNDQQIQQSRQVAQQSFMGTSPQQVGRFGLGDLARMIESRSGPGTPDDVKFAAMKQLHQLLAPDQKEAFHQAWEQFKFGKTEARHEAEFAQREADRKLDQEFRRQQLGISQGHLDIARQGGAHTGGLEGDILRQQDAERKAKGLPPMTSEERIEALGGIKSGIKSKGPLSPETAKYYADVYAQTGILPAGIARSSAAIAQIMNQAGETGTSPRDFVANMAVKQADFNSLKNMTKIADAADAFSNLAERNFDVAMGQAKEAIPTNLGPFFNKWIMTGQTTFGDEKVPPYVASLLTAANEYARVMTGATGAAATTEGARRDAANLFSPYYSQGQIEEVVKIAKTEMANRRQENRAMLKQIEDSIRTGTPRTGAPSGGGSGGAASRGAPEVSQEQYDKLQPGSEYRVPGDPTVRKKP